MPLAAEINRRTAECEEVQQSLVSSSRPFLSSGVFEPCVFEALKTALVLLRVDGSVQFASRNVNDVLGINQEETIGRHYREFVHPDDCRLFEQCLTSLSDVQRLYGGRVSAGSCNSMTTCRNSYMPDGVTPSPAMQATCTMQGAAGLQVTDCSGQNQSQNQNQLLQVPEFKKQTFACRVWRPSTGESELAALGSNMNPSTPGSTLSSGARRGARSGAPNSEYCDTEVTAFARWCSADEEVGGAETENAARILNDPHKQLCLFCVLKLCVRTAQSQLHPPAACSSQQSGSTTAYSTMDTDSSALREFLTSSNTNQSADECDRSLYFESSDPFYQLSQLNFGPDSLPDASAYTNSNIFESVLNGTSGDAPSATNYFYEPSAHVKLEAGNGPFDECTKFDELAKASFGKYDMEEKYDTNSHFASAPTAKSPVRSSITGQAGRPHLALAPSQLATVPMPSGPGHGRPSGSSESKKLRELLLQGPTGAEPDDSLPPRPSRSFSDELPPDASRNQAQYAAIRRGSFNTPPTPNPSAGPMSGEFPRDRPPTRHGSQTSGGAQTSILIQLLSNDEPPTSTSSFSPPPKQAADVASLSTAPTVTSTTSSTRSRIKRSAKDGPSDGLDGSPSRLAAIKRAASVPDGSVNLPLPTVPSASKPAPTLAQTGASLPRGPLAAAVCRTPSGRGPTELEKLLCDNQSLEEPHERRASGEPTTTTGLLNAPASTSSGASRSQCRRAGRRTRNRSSITSQSDVQPTSVSGTATPPAGVTKQRSVVGSTSELSAASPNPLASRFNLPPTTRVGSTDLEVSNLLQSYSNSSEQIQTVNYSNSNSNSNVSTPLSNATKRLSTGQMPPGHPKFPKFEPDAMDDAPNNHHDADPGCVTPQASGALMNLLTTTSPQPQDPLGNPAAQNAFAAPLGNNPNANSNGTEPSNNSQRPISSQTNAALSNYVRSKQRALSSNPSQPTVPASEPSNSTAPLQPQFPSVPPGSVYQTLGNNMVPSRAGATEQYSNSMPLSTTESPNDVSMGVYEHPPFAGAYAVDASGQPLGQPMLISAYPPGSTPVRPAGALIRAPPPPPPSYQMAMQSTPTHISENLVSSTTSADTSSGIVSSTISPSQSIPTGPMRLQSQPQSQAQHMMSMSNSAVQMSQNALQNNFQQSPYPQSAPFQLSLPNRTPVQPQGQLPPMQHYASDNSAPSGAQMPTDDISQYLQSLSSSELESLIDSVTHPPPTQPPSAPSNTQYVNMPNTVANQQQTQPQYVNMSSMHMPSVASSQPQQTQQQQMPYMMPPPGGNMQSQRPTASSTQFYNASQPQPQASPVGLISNGMMVGPPGSMNAGSHYLVRPSEQQNVRMQTDQFLRTGLDQSAMPPSAFGLPPQAQQSPGTAGLHQTVVSPRTPLISPGMRRTAPQLNIVPTSSSAPLGNNVHMVAPSGMASGNAQMMVPNSNQMVVLGNGQMMAPGGGQMVPPSQMMVPSGGQKPMVSEPGSNLLMVGGPDMPMMVGPGGNQLMMANLNNPAVVGGSGGNQMVMGGMPSQMVVSAPGTNQMVLAAPNNQMLVTTPNANPAMLNGQSNGHMLVGPNGQQMMVMNSMNQNQNEQLSGSKLAELMRAAVPPNVSLPPGTHVQIPMQGANSQQLGAPQPATGSGPPVRPPQTAPQGISNTGPAAQQKAGLVASQIVKEVELRQQQANSTQAGLLQQLQARSKVPRAEQSELVTALSSNNAPVTPGHGPRPPQITGGMPPSAFIDSRQAQQTMSNSNNLSVSAAGNSVLASLISSPSHSPSYAGAPPSSLVPNTPTPNNVSPQQMPGNARMPLTSMQGAAPSYAQQQPSSFARSHCTTPNQPSPAASSGPLPSAQMASQPTAGDLVTDELMETLERLVQVRTVHRSGSRPSASDTQHADTPRAPPKRHDSMLERLLAENN